MKHFYLKNSKNPKKLDKFRPKNTILTLFYLKTEKCCPENQKNLNFDKYGP